MEKYRAYSGYKDVGLHWVSSIPEHWSFTRNMALFEERESKNHPEKELLAVTIAYGVVKQEELAELTERKNTASDDKTNYKLVKPGDLAYNKMRMWQGAIGISPYEGIVSPAYVILKSKANIEPRYFHYQFKTPGFISEAGRYSYGLCDDMNSLRFKDFKTLYSVNPPLEEQRAISDFLDHETAKIDDLIAKQERLIELLKEKRQAVISHAVTKGLNPDAPMKDSGVEWLGEVPAHWEITKFSHHIYFQEGPGIMADDFHDEGVPLLRIENIQPGYIRLEGCNYLDPKKVAKKWNHYRLNKGDLVISASATTGIVSEVNDSAVGAIPYTGLIRLRPGTCYIIQSYIKHLVVSSLFTTQIDLLKAGATMSHFGPTHLRQMVITLPPVQEQQRISEHIDKECAVIDKTIEKCIAAIELQKEHRTALISAAVTGKIDVRDWKKSEQQSQQTAKTATG